MADWWQRTKRRFAELRRRRVLRALGLYAVGGWLLVQVADATFEPLGFPLWAQKALIIAVVAGVVPAAILAWIFDWTTGGIERTDAGGDARLALSGPGGRGGAARADGAHGDGVRDAVADPAPMSPIAAVAILPFADLSPGADHAWFCDGLAEEIIESLCCVKGLRVASRTSAFRFRDGTTDPREIGRLLGVDAILEGSLRVAGGRMRVGAKLVDAQGGFQQWTETYERPTSDVFAVQREIAENVARALKLSMTARPAGADPRPPRSLEAYEAYVRGRALMGQYTRGSLSASVGQFRRAVELDPDYAQAWAGLADSLAQMAQWRFAPPAQVLPEGTAAASRALDLAPELAEAHMAQGHLRSQAGDLAGARRSFERAVERNPALFEAWNYFARNEYANGDHARAAELFERAHRVRPDDFAPLLFASASRAKLGDTVGATALIRRAADGLVRQAALEPDSPRVHYLAAGALQQVGRTAEARAMADRALQLAPDDWSTIYNLACYHVAAGDHARALDMFERAVHMGGGYPEWMANDPDLDPLRGTPRFQALLAAIHPPPDA